MKKQCNKFKIEDFQLSEELEAILRKGHRWRLGLVWVIFLTNVLWFGYLALCWSMDWQYPFNIRRSMWPLMLFLCAVDLYAIRLPGKCPQCQNKLAEGNASGSVVHYCPNCRIYGKTGVKL